MAKPNEGNKVENQTQTAATKNEFAETIVDGKPVTPAPAPERSMPLTEEEKKAQALAAEAAAAKVAEQAEKEGKRKRLAVLQEYVAKELSVEARELGYEILMRPIEKDLAADFAGPTMMYDPKTREGRVFTTKADVPAGFVTADELYADKAE